MTLKAKRRKCRGCREWFEPVLATQLVCSIPCAKLAGPALRDKKRAADKRKSVREAKQRLKTRGDHMRDAQKAFNAYIRERDQGKPCISCGRNDGSVRAQSVGGTWDCGHYRSVGASPELRFEPLNAHRQCKRCNRDLSGNVVDYRISLIERIGQAALDWLEGPHDPKKYTIQDLIEIKLTFTKMKRELAKEREDGTGTRTG